MITKVSVLGLAIVAAAIAVSFHIKGGIDEMQRLREAEAPRAVVLASARISLHQPFLVAKVLSYDPSLLWPKRNDDPGHTWLPIKGYDVRVSMQAFGYELSRAMYFTSESGGDLILLKEMQ